MWKDPLTEEQIKNFLYRGFIADIKNYNFKLIPNNTNKTYIDCIRRPLEEYGEEHKEFNIAFSGGFDSNLILHCIKDLGYPINLFTIGAVKGASEISAAEDIVSYYVDCELMDNLNFYSSCVSPETFQMFPYIIASNPEVVFERGLFMRYVLLNLVASVKKKHLIFGECCDQILNVKSYVEQSSYVSPAETPYVYVNKVLLKKNAGFDKALGIETFYPYTSPDFIAVAYKNREKNQSSKIDYKESVRSVLKRSVGSKLKKRGGATQLITLFKDAEDIQKYETIAKASPYWKYLPEKSIHISYSEIEQKLDNIVKVLYLIILEKLQKGEPLKKLDKILGV